MLEYVKYIVGCWVNIACHWLYHVITVLEPIKLAISRSTAQTGLLAATSWLLAVGMTGYACSKRRIPASIPTGRGVESSPAQDESLLYWECVANVAQLCPRCCSPTGHPIFGSLSRHVDVYDRKVIRISGLIIQYVQIYWSLYSE